MTVFVSLFFVAVILWAAWKMFEMSKEMKAVAMRLENYIDGEDHTQRVARLARWHVPKFLLRLFSWYRNHERYLRHKEEFAQRKRMIFGYTPEKIN